MFAATVTAAVKNHHFRVWWLLLLCLTVALLLRATAAADEPTTQSMNFDVKQIDRARVMKHADAWLNDPPVTVTAEHSPRSAGGEHDCFSEGDYWGPDPKDPSAPYVQRDG